MEILGLFGLGGMGAVYKARQRELDRIVALKIVPAGIGAPPRRPAAPGGVIVGLGHRV